MKKKDTKKNIYVYADWNKVKSPILIGILHAERLRGKQLFSFEYNKEWLGMKDVQNLDPELQLYSGIQYLNDVEKSNFGVFLDSSPDRWGRILMRRREASLARTEERAQRTLFETDYLLGVYDKHRMGAIRFKEDIDGDFVNNNEQLSSPPWTSIRELEEISLKLENDDILDDPDYNKWLDMLIAPGSSLGGARPKAGVIDKNQHPWIAKFPSKNDSIDIGAWEMLTNTMAADAGINVAEGLALKFSSRHHTYMSKRFDRDKNNRRIHFASAMTLLGYTDGNNQTSGVSYLELVDFISTKGANISNDLEELWRRIVFNICVSNTDDHLRNHGFIFSSKGWILSPAYDINPVEYGTGLSLNINEDDNSLDIDLAMEVSKYFRLSKTRAIEIIEQVKKSVRNWRNIARDLNISRGEQELMSKAFSQGEK